MFVIAVRLLLRQWFGRTVPLVSAVLFLLLAFHTKSFATALESPLTDIPGCEDDDNGAQVGAPDRSPLIRNTIFTSASTSHAGIAAAPAAESAAVKQPHYTVVSEKRIPDWNGIWRDSGTLFGIQLAAAGITLLLPESISSWSSADKKNSFKKYGNNFINPVIDKDKFYINYILHPYWGATYYTRARERGLKKGESLVYSTVISSLYEFGAECFYEKPSIQDLIVTPVVGSLVGAFLFEPWRDSIKRKGELSWYDHAVLIVTDPVGVLSLGVEKLFGITPTIMIDYSIPKLQKSAAGTTPASNSTRIGVVLQFPFNGPVL